MYYYNYFLDNVLAVHPKYISNNFELIYSG